MHRVARMRRLEVVSPRGRADGWLHDRSQSAMQLACLLHRRLLTAQTIPVDGSGRGVNSVQQWIRRRTPNLHRRQCLRTWRAVGSTCRVAVAQFVRGHRRLGAGQPALLPAYPQPLGALW